MIFDRLNWVAGLLQRSTTPRNADAPTITLPSRLGHDDYLHPDEAIDLAPAYRAVAIITGAAAQLPLTIERGGHVVTDPAKQPPLVRRPDPLTDRADWIEQAMLSLITRGNLFVLKVKGPTGQVVAARILPADDVLVQRDPRTEQITYTYRQKKYTAAEVNHQALMRLPGELLGRGPIQAARSELHGAIDVRDYGANWFRGSGQPSGLLISKSTRTQEELDALKTNWNKGGTSTSENPTGVRVLAGDLEYRPLLLKPEDAQYLESRRFNVTEIARLFGVPSSLMLAALDGNSLAYANVEQEWLSFIRFTLMQYLMKIEAALTDISPAGQKIKFKVEGLLRSDTKTRYQAHKIAIEAGFMSIAEVREIEGLPPLKEKETITNEN
ncbi:phage portal protein [Dermabacteraceae bacterium CCM 9519]